MSNLQTPAPASAPGVRDSKRVHSFREPVAVRQAATILLLRPGADGVEVLMTRRSPNASFAPGAYVFPGGVLDALDGSETAMAIARSRPNQSPALRALAVAAVRESFEELGVLLVDRPDGQPADDSDVARFDRTGAVDFATQLHRAGYRIAVDRLWWLCQWITDRDMPKRFDVAFFVALMPAGQTPVADEREQFEPVWVTGAEALRRHALGEFEMIFPTERTLRRLATYPSAEAVIEACRSEKPLFVSSPRAGLIAGSVRRYSETEPPFGELELISPDGQIEHSLDWQHTKPVSLLKHVQRLTAPNPGMMTGPGTNTYIIGNSGDYTVIDPGPADIEHVQRIADIVGSGLRTILCTHAHSDHSPGAFILKELTGAPILGRPWGPRTRTYANSPAEVAQGGEALRDPAFMPDRVLEDGDTIKVGDSTLRAIFTPGHASNHLCFLLEEDGLLISGDHINNGQTVVINPPDGNMNEYLTALRRLATLPLTYILPAHGYVIGFAHQAIEQLIAHRLAREAKVLNAVQRQQTATIDTLLPDVYGDVDARLYPVAARSLTAHLDKLVEDGTLQRSGETWSA